MEDQRWCTTSDDLPQKAVSVPGCQVRLPEESSAGVEQESKEEGEGFVGGRYTSGFKAPPPSPVKEMQQQVSSRLGQRPRSSKHRKQSSFGSSAGKGRRGDEEMRNSLAALSRSKSGTITLAATERDNQLDVKRVRRESVDECEVGQTWQHKSCKCLVAFAGDCAALCCCPCTILHLLALICIRLPLTVLYGVYSRVRSRRRRRKFETDIDVGVKQVRSSFNTWPFGEQLVIDFPPYPGGFGDQKHWSFFESGSEGSVGCQAKPSPREKNWLV